MEQFRDAVTKLFSNVNLNSSVPDHGSGIQIRLVLSSVQTSVPGKPKNVAGYFLAGVDVNYITLTSELREMNPYAVIFHEYVHSLTADGARHVPLWFYEGLAEYYSTFEVTEGGGVVTLGVPIRNHVLLLRESKFLPFSDLVNVNHESAHYNEASKQGIFYAESWALTHYLILGENGRRNSQLSKYLRLLRSDSADEDAFQKSFETDFGSLEKEVRAYIGRNTYPVQAIKFKDKLQSGFEVLSTEASEATARFVLGDLLLHNRRFEEAEKYLLMALELDPNLATAHASLGALRMQQERWQEATDHLEKAVALDSKSYIAHYNYARLLFQTRPAGSTGPISKESASKIRQALKRSIELSPNFAESYRLLAHTSQISGEELDESHELLQARQKINTGT
jgi:tetratricopeptide (TPR) repeat protein